MSSYNISLAENTMTVKFGEPAQNDQIVRDAKKILDDMVTSGELAGGELLKITGPASLPVAVVIAHAVAHLYGAVAVFDPKLAKYVVSVSHTPSYAVGDLVD